MTYRDKMIEALAVVISNSLHNSPKHSDVAAAVLEMVGPKPLVWHSGSSTTTNARYTIAQSDYDDGFGEIWYILIDGKTAGKFGQFSTEEAAQAAAQEHADAAHWVNTKIGDP